MKGNRNLLKRASERARVRIREFIISLEMKLKNAITIEWSDGKDPI